MLRVYLVTARDSWAHASNGNRGLSSMCGGHTVTAAIPKKIAHGPEHLILGVLSGSAHELAIENYSVRQSTTSRQIAWFGVIR